MTTRITPPKYLCVFRGGHYTLENSWRKKGCVLHPFIDVNKNGPPVGFEHAKSAHRPHKLWLCECRASFLIRASLPFGKGCHNFVPYFGLFGDHLRD
jgi:hypothetical protein